MGQKPEFNEAMAFIDIQNLMWRLEQLKIPYKREDVDEGVVLSIQLRCSMGDLLRYIEGNYDDPGAVVHDSR